MTCKEAKEIPVNLEDCKGISNNHKPQEEFFKSNVRGNGRSKGLLWHRNNNQFKGNGINGNHNNRHQGGK